MSKKISVQLVQLNNRYGNQVYLPYSIGVLESFVKQKKKFKKIIILKNLFFLEKMYQIWLIKLAK